MYLGVFYNNVVWLNDDKLILLNNQEMYLSKNIKTFTGSNFSNMNICCFSCINWVFECWLDNKSNLKASSWTLGEPEPKKYEVINHENKR